MLEIINKLQGKLDGMSGFCDNMASNLDVLMKSSVTFNSRTGNAVNSFNCVSSGGGGEFNIELSNSAFYYPFLEEGAKPHVILGNDYLYWPGAAHPVRMVNHPGIKPHNDMKSTMNGFVPTLGKYLYEYWSDL